MGFEGRMHWSPRGNDAPVARPRPLVVSVSEFVYVDGLFLARRRKPLDMHREPAIRAVSVETEDKRREKQGGRVRYHREGDPQGPDSYGPRRTAARAE